MLQEYGTLSLYFQKGLNKDVCNRIYSRTTLPTTMEEWYQAAQQIDKQLRILKRIESGTVFPVQTVTKDPDAMDVDRVMVNKLSTQDKERYFREGRCFKCGSRGHRAAECRNKGNPTQEGRQEKERRTFKNSSNKSVRATETATITEVKEDPPAPPPKEATKEQPMTVDARVAKIKALFEGLSQEQHEQVYDALEKEGF